MSKNDNVQQEIQDIVKKNELKFVYEISFPVYRELPDELKLALIIIQKHKMVISATLVDNIPEK